MYQMTCFVPTVAGEMRRIYTITLLEWFIRMSESVLDNTRLAYAFLSIEINCIEQAKYMVAPTSLNC